MPLTTERPTEVKSSPRKKVMPVLEQIGLTDAFFKKEHRDVITMIERCIEVSAEEVDRPEFEWTPMGTVYANP